MAHAPRSEEKRHRKERRKNKRARTPRPESGQTNSPFQKYGRNSACVGLVVGFVLNVASQPIKSEIVLSQVRGVNISVPQLSSIARISRVPLLVPLVGNAQIGFMHFSPDRIKKVFLI